MKSFPIPIDTYLQCNLHIQSHSIFSITFSTLLSHPASQCFFPSSASSLLQPPSSATVIDFKFSPSEPIKMVRTSKPLLFTAFAAMGWMFLTLVMSGASDAVLVKAGTVNSAPTVGHANLPLLQDLIKCPFQTSGNLFGSPVHFLLVDCSDDHGGLLNLTDCNSALAKVRTINLASSSSPVPAPAVSLLPYNVSTPSPYTAGYYAVYVAGLDFLNLTGIAFQVNLVGGATSSNAEVIGSLVQGARGLVNFTGTVTALPVVVFPLDATVTANPCASNMDLSGVNMTSLFARAPDTVAYLTLNVSNLPSTAPFCDVAVTHVFEVGPSPSFNGTTGSCSAAKFTGTPPNPRTFYPSNFVSVADNNSSAPTTFIPGVVGPSNLNFYPYLNASGSVANGTDLASAIACINSTASSLTDFGSVSALVVECDDFQTDDTFLEHLKTCQTALHTIRNKIGLNTELLVSVQLSATPKSLSLPATRQSQFIASSVYDTSIAGAVIQLYVNETATTPANVTANFAGIAATASVFSAIFSQAAASGDQFNLFFRFDQAYCASGGPLAPQGTGDDTTSVYTNCNVAGVNCLFSSPYATGTGTGATMCGFPESSLLSWEPFRGVVTAPTTGTETNTTACNASTVVPSYASVTLASKESLAGTRLKFVSIGGRITPASAVTGANVLCLFSGDGANASYGVVECNSSSADFVNDCAGGFKILHGASAGAVIVAYFGVNASSGNLAELATTAGGLLDEVAWRGVYLDVELTGGPGAAANLEAVTTFVETMVNATTLPTDFNLTIGIVVDSVAECLTGGVLYSFNPNMTLYSRLSGAISEGVSFVLILGEISAVPVTEVCGFNKTRVGYELAVTRNFSGSCSSVSLTYDLVTLPVAVGPDNTSGCGGGGGGGKSNPSPYWALLAIPGAGILICFVAGAAFGILQHRRGFQFTSTSHHSLHETQELAYVSIPSHIQPPFSSHHSLHAPQTPTSHDSLHGSQTPTSHHSLRASQTPTSHHSPYVS